MMKAELRNLVWHDQFKTAVLCSRRGNEADSRPGSNHPPRHLGGCTDIHAKVTCLRREGRGYGRQASVNPDRVGTIATQAVADKNTKPSRSAGTNKHARALAARKL